MNLINIKGLDKAKVLSGLYNASKEPYESCQVCIMHLRSHMRDEYKIYIVGDKKSIDKVLNKAQEDELIDSYQIEET